MKRKFVRTIEDFECHHCGAVIHGDGYTNHCPHCLWSMHVDIDPGDRAEQCRGEMQPVRVEVKGGRYTLVHRCARCGVERRVKSSPEDSFEALLSIARGER